MYSTIEPQTPVKKGLFSSLHVLLISLRGLKKITTWSQVYGSQDRQRWATLNSRWMNFYLPSYFLASDNTFIEFFLKGDLLFQERRYLRAFLMIASSSHFQYRSWVQLVVIELVIMWSFFSNARSEINGPWSGPKNPPLKKRLRSILTVIVGRETNGVISWIVNFRVRLM